jgi:ferredoxin
VCLRCGNCYEVCPPGNLMRSKNTSVSPFRLRFPKTAGKAEKSASLVGDSVLFQKDLKMYPLTNTI